MEDRVAGPRRVRSTGTDRQGGFGTVYRGEQLSSGREVAVKEVSEELLRHFELSVGKLDASGRLVLVFQHSMAENHKPVARDQLLTWLARS